MSRIARVVAEGLPHHIIQRGNRRQRVFFSDADKRIYLKLLKKKSNEHQVKIWAYCLMDNHVHLVAVPSNKESLAACIGEVHKAYTRMINLREGWSGYLWQGRFISFVLDERYVFTAVRYVERNPVRSGLVNKALDYPWSSARFRIKNERNELLSDFYLMDQIKDWAAYLSDENEDELKMMVRHGSTGRPLGSKEFLEGLSQRLGIDLIPKKPGPKINN